MTIPSWKNDHSIIEKYLNTMTSRELFEFWDNTNVVINNLHKILIKNRKSLRKLLSSNHNFDKITSMPFGSKVFQENQYVSVGNLSILLELIKERTYTKDKLEWLNYALNKIAERDISYYEF